jgi:flavin reductase (DIM6/NTAB) family NADH-FMN oxidoreductase RutF
VADDPVDAFDAFDAFDALATALDAAMVVVTAADGDEADGCLVGFHAQASIHPRRYVVWLSRANRTYRIAQRSTHLAVHALGAGDMALAELFGGTSADEADKLATVEWTPGPGGVPLLTALPLRIVGRVLTELDLPEGDHVGFVLEPVDGDVARPGTPLRLADVANLDPGHPA